jgi:PAS domain S-box-containing protein
LNLDGTRRRTKKVPEQVKSPPKNHGDRLARPTFGDDIATESGPKNARNEGTMSAVTSTENVDLAELERRLEQAERRRDELERAAAAANLDQSRINALVEHSGAGVIVIDSHERVVWTNRTFREVYGTGSGKQSEPHGRACHEVLCKKSKPCDSCPVLARRCGEEAPHRELRMWVRDRVRHVYATAMPIVEPDGSVEQDLVMLQDLTDLQVLKQSEDALRASEQRFRSVFEKVAAGMITTRLDGAFLQVNPALCTMLGYTEKEFLRKVFPQTVHEEDLAKFHEQFVEVLAGRRRDIELEMRYLRKDGSAMWGHTTAVWQFDEKNQPTYCIHLIQDINQRKYAISALQESRQKYEGLINTLEGIVWEADAETFEFSFVSPQAEQILGYPVDRWLSQPRFWRNHVHPEDLQNAVEASTEARQQKRGYECEYRIVAADGNSVWLRDTVGVVQQNGEVTKLRGVMIDITKRKEAEIALQASETQLRQAQKMEAIGRLAGGIAHDFNNILTAITGYSELMQKRMGETHELYRETSEIGKAARRAADLTRQLLAFSRQQVLQPRVLDLNEVIADMNQMVRRLIGEDIELVIRHAEDLGAVKADPGQIQQVILNLAVNARDAMPSGGRLTIHTYDVVIERETRDGTHAGVEPGEYVTLAISDTGIGMEESVRSKLFEPFFTTKEQGKGTGLGLATVYGIVRQSGGEITVETTMGEGSTFRVYLPRVEGVVPVTHVAENEPDRPTFGTETILLVEDDETVRDLAVEILTINGYEVIEANNGVQALEVYTNMHDEIDMLVTDVVMPQMGGKELAERLAEVAPELKVLFLSGYTSTAIAEQQILDADSNFLQKPFTPAAFAAKVRTLLDS